uniref:Dyp-type peroxidase domain-containing protein n=1 Tax=Dietzia sp. TaxID=1871616 RepID=UPI002FDA8097
MDKGAERESDHNAGSSVSRRAVLGAAGAGVVVGGAAGAFGGAAVSRAQAGGDSATAASYPFRGDHQSGIVTPAQDRLHIAAFDVTSNDKRELADLLRTWTEAAERMTRGQETVDGGAVGRGELFPPADTGEALDLEP